MEPVAWHLEYLCLFPFIFPASAFGFIVCQVYALRAMRVKTAAGQVTLVGPDPWTMFRTLVATFSLAALLAVALGGAASLLGGAIGMLLAGGCRIELVSTTQGSRLSRRVLGFLSWRVWRSHAAVTLFVDGWGDMSDPEALSVGFDGTRFYELAWSTSKPGERAEELAAEFNDAAAH